MPKKDTTYDRIERSLFKDRGESAPVITKGDGN